MADATTAPVLPAAAGAEVSSSIPDAENVDLLLELHKDTLAATKALCPDIKPQADFPYFDDLWFLRYVLSFKQADKAAEAIHKCVAWRKETAAVLSAAPKDLFGQETLEGPMGHIFETCAKYQVASVWTPEALADHGFAVLIRGALGRPKLLYVNCVGLVCPLAATAIFAVAALAP